MKRDLTHLTDASIRVMSLRQSLHAAHSAACAGNDLLLEMPLLDLIKDVAAMENQIARVLAAACNDGKETT